MNYRTKRGQEYLQNKIKAYFDLCDAANQNKLKAEKPYTLSGLLYYLNLSADELSELERLRALRPIIGTAKRKIEAYIEENALCGRLASTAAINSLKANFGWNDKALDTKDKENAVGFEVILTDEAEELGQ